VIKRIWLNWNNIELFPPVDWIKKLTSTTARSAVAKLFWALPKPEFGEHASNNDSNLKQLMKKIMIVLMIFGSKLLSLFSMSAFHSFLNKYPSYRQRQAVVTLKIYNSGLDRLCAIHFWPFSTLVGVSANVLGTTGLDQLTHHYVKLRQQVCLNFAPEPWWESIVASFCQMHIAQLFSHFV